MNDHWQEQQRNSPTEPNLNFRIISKSTSCYFKPLSLLLCSNKKVSQTSVVVQSLRSRLPMQATFEPWPKKISHATGQLSLCATTAEPELQSLQFATTIPPHSNC